MKNLLRKFFIGEWNLGICNQAFIPLFEKVKKGGVLTLPVRWMRHHRVGSFFADPFIYQVDATAAEILAEEYVFARNKGIISLCTISRTSGKLIRRKIILEESCHLSYPFYDEPRHRFIPESFRNQNWASYSFDGQKYDNKKIIAELPIIDATPIQWNGHWYVFATTQPKALSELLIYYGDNLDAGLQPHPMNPIKDDIATSRCGGKIFQYHGDLYRIVQDSTHRYGEKMHIMKVVELSPDTFQETMFCDIRIESDGKYSMGAHTLNFKDDFIVVDGYRESFRPFFAIYLYRIIPFLRKIGLHK